MKRKLNVEDPCEFYFFDDRRLGEGWRTVVPHSRRERTIDLLDTARLINVRVKLEAFDNPKRRRPLDVPRLVVGRNIALRIARLRRFKIQYAPAIARTVMEELANDST